ncbi:uncharacterized protein LOC121348592 [Pyrgilauda ruficollis]|uniref:uncharacterized protein LOC121348592 n=1 Tax=Pyrgilauda ruficollis TaxID=221976 RepID=UPI001B883377|nr:uncharacterized protein LOC121348592 [Pyrgilauda ruficollis]
MRNQGENRTTTPISTAGHNRPIRKGSALSVILGGLSAAGGRVPGVSVSRCGRAGAYRSRLWYCGCISVRWPASTGCSSIQQFSPSDCLARGRRLPPPEPPRLPEHCGDTKHPTLVPDGCEGFAGVSAAEVCRQGAVRAEARADPAAAGRGRQSPALRPAPSRLRTDPADTARAHRAPAQSNRRSSPSLEAPCACAPPPCCPLPLYRTPPAARRAMWKESRDC